MYQYVDTHTTLQVNATAGHLHMQDLKNCIAYAAIFLKISQNFPYKNNISSCIFNSLSKFPLKFQGKNKFSSSVWPRK